MENQKTLSELYHERFRKRVIESELDDLRHKLQDDIDQGDMGEAKRTSDDLTGHIILLEKTKNNIRDLSAKFVEE